MRPCSTYREENIKLHVASKMHNRVNVCERDALKAIENGGITQFFKSQIAANRGPVQAGMEIVYWLAESLR